MNRPVFRTSTTTNCSHAATFYQCFRALESTGWRIKGPKGAAMALGLNPATLYSRMKKLGIRPGRQSDLHAS